MKLAKLSFLIAFAIAVALGGTGCHKKTKGVTPIPGQTGAKVTPSADTMKPVTTPEITSTTTPIPLGDNSKTRTELLNTGNPDSGTIGLPIGHLDLDRYDQDRGVFASDTVHFDFDRSEVKASERVKIEEVATYLKGQNGINLLVEGHCDERGTEEYNRALGERRALAIREYLVNLGIAAERIYTISYGEDRPADNGHNEAAWAKNRRGEFVALRPKK